MHYDWFETQTPFKHQTGFEFGQNPVEFKGQSDCECQHDPSPHLMKGGWQSNKGQHSSAFSTHQPSAH